MKKTYFLFSMTLVVTTILSAQELEKDKEIILTVGPTASKLVNGNIDRDESKIVDNKIGCNFNFSWNKYYKNRFGFGIGLGYSNYKQTINQKGLFVRSNLTDKDGYSYDLWENANMVYTSNLNYIDVPIMLHLLIGKSSKCYGFIDAGIVNGFLIGGKYTKKGSLEDMNTYPATTSSGTPNPYFYLVSHSNPYYGNQVQSFDKTYTDSYKFYNASLRVSFGIAGEITDKLILQFAPVLTKGLSDITGSADKGKDYSNVFGDKSGYKATQTFSLGLNVGIAIKL